MNEIKLYTDNITIDNEHKYSCDSITNVTSVTSILTKKQGSFNPNQAMIKGTLIHKAVEYKLKNRIEEFKSITSGFDGEMLAKLQSLLNYLKDVKVNYSEVSFVADDNGCKFGGTADAITDSTAIDFKTGGFNSYYDTQIAVYAKVFQKNEGLILYFEGGILKERYLSNIEIDKHYNSFISQVKNYNSVLTDIDEEMLNKFKTYDNLQENINMLTEKQKLIKEELEDYIKANNINKYVVDKYSIAERAGNERKIMKKEIQNKLLETKPDWFDIKTTKPSFTVSLGKSRGV